MCVRWCRRVTSARERSRRSPHVRAWSWAVLLAPDDREPGRSEQAEPCQVAIPLLFGCDASQHHVVGKLAQWKGLVFRRAAPARALGRFQKCERWGGITAADGSVRHVWDSHGQGRGLPGVIEYSARSLGVKSRWRMEQARCSHAVRVASQVISWRLAGLTASMPEPSAL